MQWTEKDYLDLKRQYESAVSEGQEQFVFQGVELLTTFAKVIAPVCGTGSVIGTGFLNAALAELLVGDGDAEGVGESTGLTRATPLSQTNFFPTLIHVNFFEPELLVAPAFEHAAPAAVMPA